MLKAISLFTGVGGLDFGFEAAGFETRVAVEMDAVACRTMRLNRKWAVLEGDIHDITSEQILAAARLRTGEADVLLGGPPCQPFSKSSYWVRGDALRLDDPRADTLTAYLRVLRDTKPRAFLLENVPGFAYKGKDEGLLHFIAGLEEVNRQAGTNYTAHWQVINSAKYGVPQVRERIFLVGSRDGSLFTFPAATHGDPLREGFDPKQFEPYRNAWDALGDLPENPNDEDLFVRGRWADLLPSIPEGANYLFHTNRGEGMPLFGWRTRYWSFLLKLRKTLPSWTIQAQPGPAIGPFHWANRKLSAAELCRLQTFPDGLQFDCSRNEVQRLIGNAVPSLVTEILGRAIRQQFLDAPVRAKRLKLIPPRRKETPEPKPPTQVPAKYHHFVGDHADHPGEGKGSRAIQRQSSEEPSQATQVRVLSAIGA